VDALYGQYLAGIVPSDPVIARRSQAEMILEITVMKIDSVPVHYISKRKREGAQKRLTFSYSNQVLVSVKFMLMLSASFFYISFLQIT